MYLVRFCYDFAPIDRDVALDLIGHELDAARRMGLSGRLLVPLTRPPGGPSLVFEVEVERLEQVESLRHGGGDDGEIGPWARELSKILLQPPHVEILRISDTPRSQPTQLSA